MDFADDEWVGVKESGPVGKHVEADEMPADERVRERKVLLPPGGELGDDAVVDFQA